MTPLMTLLVTNVAVVLKTSTVIAASAAAIAVSVTNRPRDTLEADTVAHHTLADIGFEPGALTWIH